ncbi:hypothetical protein [Haloprofundus marisrubri]|uniref:hypothetical protein n=1 Tax=Haloprofundus marisrubri TaxID=1514971 RepID=UPI0012BAD8C0|nr:hypothetical protein [Haloprofundus marisrubri]
MYIPRSSNRDDAATDSVRLFVPQYSEYSIPAESALDSLFVATEADKARGISLVPSGIHLYREFHTSGRQSSGETGSVAESVDELVDAVLHMFELADTTETTVEAESGRVRVAFSSPTYSRADVLENPIASFLAVGLAQHLRRPVSTTVTATEDTLSVVCQWDIK